MTIEERVAKLEAQQHLATRADIADMRLEISRDIANLAGGIASDLRAIRQELAGIRELLQHQRAFRWPWERTA